MNNQTLSLQEYLTTFEIKNISSREYDTLARELHDRKVATKVKNHVSGGVNIDNMMARGPKTKNVYVDPIDLMKKAAACNPPRDGARPPYSPAHSFYAGKVTLR